MPWPADVADAVRAAVEISDAVFVGEVVRIERPGADLEAASRGMPDVTLATLVVLERWKGTESDTLVVRTPGPITMCGFDFKVGGRYLVYADHDAAGGLGTTTCARTAEVEGAQEDLEALRLRYGRGGSAAIAAGQES